MRAAFAIRCEKVSPPVADRADAEQEAVAAGGRREGKGRCSRGDDGERRHS